MKKIIPVMLLLFLGSGASMPEEIKIRVQPEPVQPIQAALLKVQDHRLEPADNTFRPFH